MTLLIFVDSNNKCYLCAWGILNTYASVIQQVVKPLNFHQTSWAKRVLPIFSFSTTCVHRLPQALNVMHSLVLCRMSWYLPGVDELHTLQPGGEEGLWAQSTLAPVRQHVLQLWVRWQSSGHHWQLISALLEDQPGWELLNTLNYSQQHHGKVIVKTNHFRILMTSNCFLTTNIL